MEFFFSLMLSPCAVAALVLAMYYVYPKPLIRGFARFGGYLLAGMYRKFESVDGIEYCYYDRPGSTETAPTVIFIHGFTSDKTMWLMVSKYLPKEWRIIILDLPGHGESSFKTNCDYSARGFAKLFHEFVVAIGIEKFHLVGLSLGALISGTYAGLHPERLHSVTVMCPPGVHKLPTGVKSQFFKRLESTGENQILPENSDEFQKMIDLVLYDPLKFTYHHRMREALVALQKLHYPYFKEIQDHLMKCDREETEESVLSMAASITMPMLILWGEHDKICDPSGAKLLGLLVKHAKIVILEKCGHVITMDRPRRCAQLLQNFVTKQVTMKQVTMEA